MIIKTILFLLLTLFFVLYSNFNTIYVYVLFSNDGMYVLNSKTPISVRDILSEVKHIRVIFFKKKYYLGSKNKLIKMGIELKKAKIIYGKENLNEINEFISRDN